MTLTIPAESLTGSTTLTLTLLDDDISEDSEELEVRGTNADPGLPVNAALIAIDDNDAAPTGVTLTLDMDRVPEDAGLQQLTVTGVLTGGGKRTVDTTVTLTVSNVTATDADYTYLPAELRIQSGQAKGAGTLLLVPTDDLIDEDDETLEVRGVIDGPGLTVTVQRLIITDNDSAGVTITPTSLTVLESRSNSYTVRLNTEPTGDVTVAISGHTGTALTLSGTTLVNDSLTFTTENWSAPQTVAVTAGAVTADTNVTLSHGISGGDYGSVTADDVVVTVVDVPENQVTIQVGVSVSRQNLAVPEGGSNTYEVVLARQPTGDVTVTVTVDDTANNDVTTAEETLVFTTANWNEPKTVTVRAAEDDDALTDSGVTISHTVGGANYEGVTAPGLTVTITEDDADGVTISPTTLTVTEGDATGVSYNVKLNSQPAGDVTVTVSGHSGTDLSISGTTLSGDDELTFTTANWGTAQTVTVKAAEDEDGVTDADVTLAHAISSTDDSVYNALADQSVTVSITDNDAVGVTIDPTTLTVTEGDATGLSYTVVLTSQPAGDVIVAISGHSGTDLSISGTTLSGDDELTFTTANWGTAQTVTVKAAEDEDGVTDADVTLAHDISSTDDSVYNALADQSVTVTITENDADGVTISPTTLTVTEGDASGVSYTVVLTSQPAGDVTVTVSGHSGTDLTLSSAGLSEDGELTFTTENWGTAQTVTVKAAEDDDAVTDADVTLTHAISSTDDSTYDALANQSVTVSITENDADGVTISPTTLTVAEGDASGVSYTVVLSSQPAGDVTVAISGHASTDLSISGTTLSGDDELTFTTSTWDTVQTVTVKAAEDEDAATDADVTLTHAISSTDDSTYDALANQSVTVSITEDDAVGVTISPTTLTVTEGDAAGLSYTVVLTSQPAGDVKVTVSGHANTDLTLSSAALTNNVLTFTTSTWDTAQTVTVKVAEDEDAVTDADVTLVHDISSTDDSVYNALADQSVTVSITDNDADGVTISPTTLTVTEGDATGVSYTVVLTSQPAGDVTVAISGHASTDLSISGTTLSADNELTFTTANWGTAQTVTVKAAEDDDAVTDADVTLTHAISSTDDSVYNALADQSVTVSITDNDADGVTISPTTLTVTEGDATGVSYTVVLTSQPAGDVTVAISGHASTDLSLSGTTLSNDNELTFTTTTWETAQTVTVKAAEDADAVKDADVTLSHAISSTDDSVYNALANQSVTVSITDNDADGVTISPTTLTVTEGDATGVSYTVVLTSQPAGDVTVAISGHANTDLSISGTTLSGDDELTFTTENWGTAQTVTVKAAEDDDAVTDADVTLTHAISSTDDSTYDALADQSVTVSITDNDADGVTINTATLTVTEGDASGVSYTVVLNSQPAGDVTVAISGHASTDLSISGTTLSGDNELTFTTENWGTAQTVTVKAAEDDDAVTDADVTLTHAISSTDDSVYNALAAQSVTVSITDNDADGVTISPTTLTVTEGDATGVSYTVVLTSQPAGDVTVAISGHSGTDLSISGTTLSGDNELTFTTENWGTAQTVTVKAAEDEDAVTDADVTLTHAISSTDDSVYNALADQSVTVSITENDDPAVTVNFEQETYSVAEGADVTVKVKLSAIPEREVVVPVTTTNQGGATSSDYSGVPTSVTFQSGDTEKSFTFSADQDTVDDDDESVKLGFGTLPARVTAGTTNEATVSITDDDGPTVTVSFEKEVHYTIEGASGVAGVEVLLSAPLQTEVTIPITVLSQSTAAPEDYVVSDSAGYASDPGLTFSPGETFGYVFIRAVLDTIDEETETVVLGFGTLPAGVSEGSPNRSTVEVSDAIQVSFADSTYMVEEGSAGVEVMVRLNKPRNNLRVPLTANGQGGADDSDFTGVPPEVVFKDDETEKTFTFVAMEDSEEENGEMVRLGFGAFSEGMVAIFPDSAMVMIDEPAGVPDSAMVMIDDAGAPAPRHFAASWPTQTSITLTWFTVETAAEYKLEYRKQGESEWTRISGDFDHLPSTSDHRDAFGVAAGLECETRYEFRASARGSGETRNDGSRYSSTLFGSYATTSAQTGECAEVERVTNLLVSVEPRCATLTWTPPSGDRDTGYRVERYSYTNNRNQVTEPETLVEQANRIADRYQDCSAEYRTPGAEHVYIVTALDDDPEPDEEGAFGSAYTSILVYGPGWVSEGPLNVRLTHDAQTSRGLAWDAPRDPWLTTVRTARAGSGPQRVALDPWVTGYRVERREYRRTEGGDWELQGDWETLRYETDGDTGTSFTDSKDKGDKQYVYRVWSYNDWGRSRYSFRGDWAFNGGDPGGDPEQAVHIPPPPSQQQGGETPSNTPATGAPAISGTPRVGETLTADTSTIDDEDGLENVTYRYQWTAGESDIGGATGSTFTLTASEQGQTIQVRVTFTDDLDNAETLTSIATAAVTAAPVPLTVSVTVSAPATHDGSSEFTFEIEFSEEVKLSYVTLKNHAFNVTGGAVERAQRTDKPSNISWLITVKPQGNGDVTIELPATTDCNATGAICTGDGRKLSNSLSFTVSGSSG